MKETGSIWGYHSGGYEDFYILEFSFYADFLLGLFFDIENGGDIFFRNINWLSMDDTVIYLRKYKFPTQKIHYLVQ
jgi:hypothetical protein